MQMQAWYLDREARTLILLRYLPWLAGLNLAWEIAHLPLYTLWNHATPAYLAFSVAHCTLGDVAIGALALALALVATSARSPTQWGWNRIAVLTVLAAVSYTAFSEWMNTLWLGSWTYSGWMPLVGPRGFEIGLSPLLQWLLLPPLALRLARGVRNRGRPATERPLRIVP